MDNDQNDDATDPRRQRGLVLARGKARAGTCRAAGPRPARASDDLGAVLS